MCYTYHVTIFLDFKQPKRVQTAMIIHKILSFLYSLNEYEINYRACDIRIYQLRAVSEQLTKRFAVFI